jgi:hypothetical protein
MNKEELLDEIRVGLDTELIEILDIQYLIQE